MALYIVDTVSRLSCNTSTQKRVILKISETSNDGTIHNKLKETELANKKKEKETGGSSISFEQDLMG